MVCVAACCFAGGGSFGCGETVIDALEDAEDYAAFEMAVIAD
jgi:hypothetical protein